MNIGEIAKFRAGIAAFSSSTTGDSNLIAEFQNIDGTNNIRTQFGVDQTNKATYQAVTYSSGGLGHQFRFVNTVVGSYDELGAWIVGPAAFTADTKHSLNGQMATIFGAKTAVAQTPANMLDFASKPSGIYLVSTVREGGSVGTNGLYIVGNSVGTAVLYATLLENGQTAAVSTSYFQLSQPEGTLNLYANALFLVGGS